MLHRYKLDNYRAHYWIELNWVNLVYCTSETDSISNQTKKHYAFSLNTNGKRKTPPFDPLACCSSSNSLFTGWKFIVVVVLCGVPFHYFFDPLDSIYSRLYDNDTSSRLQFLIFVYYKRKCYEFNGIWKEEEEEWIKRICKTTTPK